MPASLPKEATERLRKVVRDDLLPLFRGKHKSPVQPAAKAIGVSQSTLSRLVTEASGGSVDLANRVAEYVGKSPDEIISGLPAPAPSLRELPTWRKALAEAKVKVAKERRSLSDSDLERVGLIRTSQIKRITAAVIVEIATAAAQD